MYTNPSSTCRKSEISSLTHMVVKQIDTKCKSSNMRVFRVNLISEVEILFLKKDAVHVKMYLVWLFNVHTGS